MTNVSPLLRLVVISFAVSLSLICAASSGAQSGRRVRKSEAPAPTPEPTPTPDQPSKKEEGVVTFIVGVDRYHGFSAIPFSYYDTIARACAGRLDDQPSVRIVFGQKDMTRSDAVRKAQAEKEAYVVWLQLQVQSVSGDPSRVDNLNALFIEYAVFAPTTAKQVAWGHTYQQGTRKGPVVVGPSTSSRSNIDLSERRLKEAAREAAERILSALKLRSIPPHVACAPSPPGIARFDYFSRVQRVNRLAIFLVNYAPLYLQRWR